MSSCLFKNEINAAQVYLRVFLPLPHSILLSYQLGIVGQGIQFRLFVTNELFHGRGLINVTGFRKTHHFNLQLLHRLKTLIGWCGLVD